MVINLSIDTICNDIILVIDKMISHREGLVRKVRYQEYKFNSVFIRCTLFRDNDSVIIKLYPMNITGRNQIIPNIESYIENAYPNVEVRINRSTLRSKPAFTTIHSIKPYSLNVYDMNISEELDLY